MIQPTNKYLMADYRSQLGTNDAPQMIDTEIPLAPVVMINRGLPTASASQRLRWAELAVGNVSTQYQIATASSTLKVYLVAVTSTTLGAASTPFRVFDAISGAGPNPAANTMVQDQSAGLIYMSSPAVAGSFSKVALPISVQVQNGIRLVGGGAGQAAEVIVYWLEETLV